MDLSKSLVLESDTMYIISYPIEIIDTKDGNNDIRDVMLHSSSGKGVTIETIKRNEACRIPLTVFI